MVCSGPASQFVVTEALKFIEQGITIVGVQRMQGGDGICLSTDAKLVASDKSGRELWAKIDISKSAKCFTYLTHFLSTSYSGLAKLHGRVKTISFLDAPDIFLEAKDFEKGWSELMKLLSSLVIVWCTRCRRKGKVDVRGFVKCAGKCSSDISGTIWTFSRMSIVLVEHELLGTTHDRLQRGANTQAGKRGTSQFTQASAEPPSSLLDAVWDMGLSGISQEAASQRTSKVVGLIVPPGEASRSVFEGVEASELANRKAVPEKALHALRSRLMYLLGLGTEGQPFAFLVSSKMEKDEDGVPYARTVTLRKMIA